MSRPHDSWQVANEQGPEPRQRGELILKTVLGIRNVRVASIASHIQQLLSSDVWREYVLPNGKHYSWRSAEFDFFLMATDLDPVLIDQAVRSSGDRQLCLAFASACNGSASNRRRMSQVVAEHPELGSRLRELSLGGQLKRVVGAEAARDSYLAGASPSRASGARDWFTVGWAPGLSLQGKAEHLARRILSRDAQLAAAVRESLSRQLAEPHTSRADAGASDSEG